MMTMKPMYCLCIGLLVAVTGADEVSAQQGARLVMNPAELADDTRLQPGQTMDMRISAYDAAGNAVPVDTSRCAPLTGNPMVLDCPQTAVTRQSGVRNCRISADNPMGGTSDVIGGIAPPPPANRVQDTFQFRAGMSQGAAALVVDCDMVNGETISYRQLVSNDAGTWTFRDPQHVAPAPATASGGGGGNAALVGIVVGAGILGGLAIASGISSDDGDNGGSSCPTFSSCCGGGSQACSIIQSCSCPSGTTDVGGGGPGLRQCVCN